MIAICKLTHLQYSSFKVPEGLLAVPLKYLCYAGVRVLFSYFVRVQEWVLQSARQQPADCGFAAAESPSQPHPSIQYRTAQAIGLKACLPIIPTR